MQHAIPVEHLGSTGAAMANAVEKCVHCGFCLPVCPTYLLLGEEMDSPRGRIILMKSVLEGNLPLDEALPYIDRCLGCQGCVTACPSGVPYGELIAPFRDYASSSRSRSLEDRFARSLVLATLPHPARFRMAAQAGALARPYQRLLPGKLRQMLEMLPADLPDAPPLPGLYPARGERRARVALLVGCVQQALSPQIIWATLRVLARNGIEVVIPAGQGCCGGLSMHTGAWEQARELAAANLLAFPQDLDAVLTNAAGCGSAMHEYPLLFKGTPLEERAQAFSRNAFDVCVFLDHIGVRTPPPMLDYRLAYHDACHLAHAQGITTQPRRLLSQIQGLTLVPIAEADLCCGSAGTYNLEQPEIARQLGERKADAIIASGAQAVAAGNIGCLVQIKKHLSAAGGWLPTWHTLEILDMAYSSCETAV